MARFNLQYVDNDGPHEMVAGADSITYARRKAVALFKSHLDDRGHKFLYWVSIFRAGRIVGQVTYREDRGGWVYMSVSDKMNYVIYRLHPFGNIVGKPLDRGKILDKRQIYR